MRWTMGVNGNQDWVEGSGGGSGAEGTFESDSFDPRSCLVYIASEYITYSRFRKRCPLPFFSPGYDRDSINPVDNYTLACNIRDVWPARTLQIVHPPLKVSEA